MNTHSNNSHSADEQKVAINLAIYAIVPYNVFVFWCNICFVPYNYVKAYFIDL